MFNFGKITVTALTAMLIGCTGVQRFEYDGRSGGMATFTEADKTVDVAVLPFIDKRDAKYFEPGSQAVAVAHPAGDHGSLYMGFLPLVIAGYVEKEQPENSTGFVTIDKFHFNPSYDLADAAVQSLKYSKLFGSVSLANNKQQAESSDYTFVGEITNTYYSGSVFSYGITYILASPFWVIGAPYGGSENELWVEFKLIDNKTGKKVWSYPFKGTDRVLQWIYTDTGVDVGMYAKLMKKAMNAALYDLNRNQKAVFSN